jgi:hypothetical protein
MSHRANFVVIRDGEATAYHDQWAATGCIYAFAAGPDAASEAVTEMEQTTELLDWAFAEAGYLIDFDRRAAICFGTPCDLEEFGDILEEAADELLNNEVASINAALERGALDFLQHIAPAWPGWTLTWDDRGVDAFAAYLRRCNIVTITAEPDSHPPDTAQSVSVQA